MHRNNNPSAKQLIGILRALLTRAGVIASSGANCVAQDDTLVLPVDNACIVSCDDTRSLCPVSNTNQTESAISIDAPFLTDHTYAPPPDHLSHFVTDITEYIAGWVVRKLLPELRCTECIAAAVAPVTEAVKWQTAQKCVFCK